MSSFTGQPAEEPPFNSNIPPINSNSEQSHVLSNSLLPDLNITNTDSRLVRIEERLDTIEQLLTQQAQLADNSFASQGPLNFSDLVAQTNDSFQSMSTNTTRESNVSAQSLGGSLGGKNKTKSNKKKKSKNQTKRKRKV